MEKLKQKEKEKTKKKIKEKESPVQDIPIGKYSDIQVWSQYSVEPSCLLVPEEGVGHPDFAGVGHRQVADLV